MPLILNPTVFLNHKARVCFTEIHENEVTEKILKKFLSGTVGVAAVYGSECALISIALSTMSDVLLVRLSKSKPSVSRKARKRGSLMQGRNLLRDLIFCHPARPKCAFQMDKLATALFLDLGLRVTLGIDLLSVATTDRHSNEAVFLALGGAATLHKPSATALFKPDARNHNIALQAWAACYAAALPSVAIELANIRMINTKDLGEARLTVLTKLLRDAERLDALKPTRVKNEIKGEFTVKSKKLNVSSDRFKTRIRWSSTQTIEVTTVDKGKKKVVSGRTEKVKGRAATISLQDNFCEKKFQVHTVGKDPLTCAEELRENVVLKALQGSNNILDLPFVQSLWLPNEVPNWPPSTLHTTIVPASAYSLTRALNPSQEAAVKAILSPLPADRLVLIHGPPGTGKTSVIACATQTKIKSGPPDCTIWLVAQSNVAVKNIAEKLAESNFLDFQILVSRDFHFDWHEHLYVRIERNVITSDTFHVDINTMSRRLSGSRVILCTLGMMSNDKISDIVRLVPVETVIVDEASQIEVGDYVPMLSLFQRKLKKMVFIGDDKQLAPYGQSDLGDLQSIFEMAHLRHSAIFLDTQYRMPVPLGNFISEHVYDNRLKTVHAITTFKCCRFVDCRKGKEERHGGSYVNLQEVRVIVEIARRYSAQRKSFRIITPYDAQRSKIEAVLKTENIHWEDKCFNVDSFQGNEDDYILISLVRSSKIGFLQESRRMNVMLTRCKRGMIICTSQAFIGGVAASSLVAVLAERLGPKAWVDSTKTHFI